jgi:lysylphosphatidylglycerol synthetase-like protein (DUF2156 family)
VIRFQGRPVAFANLLETHSHDLASLDLMRAHPDAPKLTMEFMMVGLILHYKSHDTALQPGHGAAFRPATPARRTLDPAPGLDGVPPW